MSRSPFTSEERLLAVEDYLNGRRSITQICEDLNISSHETIRKWVLTYREHGVTAFIAKSKNNSYTKEFKTKVVEEYLAGGGSLPDLISKYKIPSTTTLRKWIIRYNSDMELKDYDPKQEVYIATSRRKTTIKERKEIVAYCIEHNRNYKNTAEKYDVSYSQVYSWVQKYDSAGEEGLTDKRGRHTTEGELDELEKLRRENKRLKRQLEERE